MRRGASIPSRPSPLVEKVPRCGPVWVSGTLRAVVRKTWLVVPLALAACGGDTEGPPVARARSALAVPGPWHIPPETLAIGDTQYVTYTGAGPWLGEEGCYGGISPGTALLRDYLYTYFPQTYHIGGYACRPINGNASQMSVHATGRALDIMLLTEDGEADNGAGDPIGNWLIENAEAIGIQFIIWDLYTWGASRPVGDKGRDYGGAHPHHDHLHIELSVEQEENEELWFLDAVTPPPVEGCHALPRAGGIIEETDPCFRAFGPAEYWRTEDAGSGGSLLWTNAFENDRPSNWARWNVYVEESGTYAVEVYVDADWGVHREARYHVTHAGGQDVLYVDQSTEHGWVSLGDFELSTAHPTWIDVFDDVPGPIDDDQRIAVDAVRLTGSGFEPPVAEPEPDPPPPTDDDDGTPRDSGAATTESGEGGCSVAGPPRGSARWLLAVGALALLRRGPRRRVQPAER